MAYRYGYRRRRRFQRFNEGGEKTVVVDRRFNSFDDILTYAEGPSAMPDTSRASRRQGEVSFFGTKDFASAIHQAKYGWPEGLRQIQKLADSIKTLVAAKATLKSDTFYSTSGACVDVGRYLSGEPEDMLEFEMTESAGKKIFTVTLNVAASACVHADTLYNRGAAVIALVDLLEKAGYSCEIMAVDPRERNGKLCVVRVPVKVAGQHLDQDRLAFAVASPSFLRRLLFSCNEREDMAVINEFGFHNGGGYGMPSNLPNSVTEAERGVYLPSLYGYCAFDTQEGAVEWVIQEAGKLIELETAEA